MKIKIEQITIIIILILIVIAALIMIGYRRVLKMEERIEGLEKVLLVIKKGVDSEHLSQNHIIDNQNIMPNVHLHEPNINMMDQTFQNMMQEQQNMENNFTNMQKVVQNDDNISIESLSDSESENESSEYEKENEESYVENNEEDKVISEYEDDDEDEGDGDDESLDVNNESNIEEITSQNDSNQNDGIDILLKEERNRNIRNENISLNDITESYLIGLKRPELFDLCAKFNVKVNKREDRKMDLINRITDFQKKNVSNS